MTPFLAIAALCTVRCVFKNSALFFVAFFPPLFACAEVELKKVAGTNNYTIKISKTIHAREPYKIPPNELDISYIKPFDLNDLSCKNVVAEWRLGQAHWVELLKRM